jgi:hypothetical protein
MQPKTAKYLELIFPHNVSPGDLEIVEAATEVEPGRARLLAAKAVRINGCGERVFSANGGALIGIVGYGQAESPYLMSYQLMSFPPDCDPRTVH